MSWTLARCSCSSAPCPTRNGSKGQLATDEAGFLLTGREVRDRPLFLETSRPGIFAVGDVHSGSIKRVASAVAEGSMAVRLIHQRLAAPVCPTDRLGPLIRSDEGATHHSVG